MIRITSGKLKGRRIPLPDPDIARPTTDKVRQAVFNVIESRYLNTPWEDMQILDAFSGSGALGIEALSRGARHCTFIEPHHQTRKILKNTLETLSLDNITLHKTSFFKTHLPTQFDFIFLDPPFPNNLWDACLEHIMDQNLLSPDGLIIMEMDKKNFIKNNAKLKTNSDKIFGNIKVLFLSKNNTNT